MRIYTASKFENAAFVRVFNDQLRALGHIVTWDWTDTDEFDEFGVLVDSNISHFDRRRYGMLDYAGVMQCDLLILIDYEVPVRGGAWEAGMAIGAGKEVWIVNYQHKVIFDVLPQVRMVSTPNVALSLLDSRGSLA